MSRLSLVQVSVWAALLVACGPTELVVDAGPLADAGGPAGQITIESEPSLTLSFAEQADLVVRYTVDGQPAAGVPIRFALEGAAHDATVSALSLETDRDGRVETSVIAGSVAAVFRVRVSAERAARAYVNVSISNQGFGALVARAAYDGRRDEATRRVISVYSDTECDPPGGLPAFPDRMATLDDPETIEARWAALPAGLSYALVGRVEGPTGATLATACVDGVEVLRDDEVYATLDFRDAQLAPGGQYDVDVELEPTASITRVAERAEDGAVAVVAGEGAKLLLDGIEAELLDRGETTTADALGVERMTGIPEADLQARLDAAMTGPDVAARRWVAALAANLSVIRLGGTLDLALVDGQLRASWQVERLEIGPAGEPDRPPPLELDPTALAVDYAPELTLRWDAEADLLRVDAWELTLPLGSLVATAIDTRAATVGSLGELLVEGAGCDELADWAADSVTVGPVCDAACVQAACVRALEPVAEAMRSAALTIDDTLDAVTVEGSVAATDEDGDLAVDVLEGRGLSGAWTGPVGLEADVLSADVVGARVSLD